VAGGEIGGEQFKALPKALVTWTFELFFTDLPASHFAIVIIYGVASGAQKYNLVTILWVTRQVFTFEICINMSRNEHQGYVTTDATKYGTVPLKYIMKGSNGLISSDIRERRKMHL